MSSPGTGTDPPESQLVFQTPLSVLPQPAPGNTSMPSFQPLLESSEMVTEAGPPPPPAGQGPNPVVRFAPGTEDPKGGKRGYGSAYGTDTSPTTVEIDTWLSDTSALGGAARALAITPSFTARMKAQIARARTWVEQKERVMALVWWLMIAAVAPLVLLAGVNYHIVVLLWGFWAALAVATIAFVFMAVSHLYYRLGIAMCVALAPFTVFEFWDATYRDPWVEALSYWLLTAIAGCILLSEVRFKGEGLALVTAAVLFSLFQAIDYTIQWRWPRPSSSRYQWVAVVAAVLTVFFFVADEINQDRTHVGRRQWRRARVRLKRVRRTNASSSPQSPTSTSGGSPLKETSDAPRPRNLRADMVAYASGIFDVDGSPLAVTEDAVIPQSSGSRSKSQKDREKEDEGEPLITKTEEQPVSGVPPTCQLPPPKPTAVLLHASALCAIFCGFYFTLSSDAFTDGKCFDGDNDRLVALIIWAGGLVVLCLFNFRQRRPQWVCLLIVGTGVLCHEMFSCVRLDLISWVLLGGVFFLVLIIIEIPTIIRLRDVYRPAMKMHGVVEGRTACTYFLKSVCRAIILMALLFILTFLICEVWFPMASWLRDQESCPPTFDAKKYNDFVARLPSNPPRVPVLYAPGKTAATARLNESLIIGTHNSYHQTGLGALLIPEWDYSHPPLIEQLERGYRELEIDIHWIRGVFHVYHVKLIDDQTSCRCLDTCFQMINQWSIAKGRSHQPLIIHIEFRGFTSNDLVCKRGTQIADSAMTRVQNKIEEYFGNHTLYPREVRCKNGECKDSVFDALGDWGWPLIADMIEDQKMFVFTLNLFGSNEDCRDVYYRSARYQDGTEVMFDRVQRDHIPNARETKTSAFIEGFDQWLQSGRTGLITRIRNTQQVESRQTITNKYEAFPTQILDYDKSPGTLAS